MTLKLVSSNKYLPDDIVAVKVSDPKDDGRLAKVRGSKQTARGKVYTVTMLYNSKIVYDLTTRYLTGVATSDHDRPIYSRGFSTAPSDDFIA